VQSKHLTTKMHKKTMGGVRKNGECSGFSFYRLGQAHRFASICFWGLFVIGEQCFLYLTQVLALGLKPKKKKVRDLLINKYINVSCLQW